MLEDWHFTKEFGYVQAEGRVTNTTSSPMANVEVVVEYFTADGTFVKSSEAMIAYNPVLSGQT